MKVLFVNTFYQSGGAAIAAKRLQEALKPLCEVTLLTQDPVVAPAVLSVSNTFVSTLKSKLRFIAERIYFLLYEKDKSIRFQFSPANTGIDITALSVFKQADIIHLHWTNQGFISLEGLQQIFQSGKPVVITMHDFWYFTGGCHYPGTCNAYMQSCGNCPFLKHPSEQDLSHRLHARKHEIFRLAHKLTLVGCSEWLKTEASNSSILAHAHITSIPNALPLDQFIPHEQQSIRLKYQVPMDKKILLFGSMNIHDPRKGFQYFKDALVHLATGYSKDSIEIVVFGSVKNNITEELDHLPYKVIYLGKIQPKDIAEVYSLADVYVSPSLEDNLPNTVAEAMACGVPVVAFNTGGLPEMIDHKQNGYIAEFKNESDLAEGIRFILDHNSPEALRAKAREKAEGKYLPEKIAQEYMAVYSSLL